MDRACFVIARKLLSSGHAVKLTEKGIFLNHIFRTRFYPRERFSKVSIEPRFHWFTGDLESRSELDTTVTFHNKSEKGMVKYHLLQVNTTFTEFIDALKQFMPVEISQDVQDLIDTDQ
jgi:hypothetical protein